MSISSEARFFIGFAFIALPTIAFGGSFLLSLLRKWNDTEPSAEVRAYFRAGHAHAGVLVIVSIVAQLMIDAARLEGAVGLALRIGFLLAPILISAGFFGGAPRETGKPGPLIRLVIIGALLLAIVSIILGVSLIFDPGTAAA